MTVWQDRVDRVLGSALADRNFGETVTFRPHPYTPGTDVTVRGIFSSAYQALDPNSGAIISSSQPTLGIRLADFTSPPRAGEVNPDRFVIRGTVYRVADLQPDGQGGAMLYLHKI